jgi:transcription antitermination factor NusG
MDSGNPEHKWFALIAKPQHEFRVLEGLASIAEVEGFLPTYKNKRRWSDRVKILDTPLFSGYVFARFAWPAMRVPVLRTVGVRSILSFGNEPCPLPDEQIENIRTLVNSPFAVQPWPFLKAGERVRVEHGPLRGVEGIVLERKDGWRMVVSVEILQRSVSVVLDRSMLTKVGGTPAIVRQG